jgi:hypothetical protein
MSIQLVIGPEAINSYQRLSYTPWHAIAEFVDNSTQSYMDNKDVLDAQLKKEDRIFEVSIAYEANEGNGMLRVSDNAMGMSYTDLERALHIAMPPTNCTGRSRYGMGMKTAAFWIGRKWRIQTKKLGETEAHEVTIDVDKIISSKDMNVSYRLFPARIRKRTTLSLKCLITIANSRDALSARLPSSCGQCTEKTSRASKCGCCGAESN